ncbi:MAG: RNA-binding S4 domain-containing protein [Alphaproteobacteria bacterium]|nr:RNA-binding S4 domain-containing protein [Alphaproteobacteria bacterium]
MTAQTLRIDKWLWYARFLKSRTQAAALCSSGKLRLNSETVHKPHQVLRVGDVLTFPLGLYIRVISVSALTTRRGPATEAQALYEDLDPPQPKSRAENSTDARVAPVATRERGSGRPTKTERRASDRLRTED